MPRKLILVDALHRSVDVTAGERMQNTSLAVANMGNTWTMSAWVKPSGDYSALRYLFSVIYNSGFPFSNIYIFLNQSGFTALNANIYGASALLIKNYTWLAAWSQNTWVNLTVTWDGDSFVLKAYNNGVENTAVIKWTDNTGGQIDYDQRRIGVGTRAQTASSADDFLGRIFSCAAWDVVLSAAAIKEIHNGGYGEKFDLLTNRGNYTSAANLQHYWRPGHYYPPTTGIGRDYGVATTNRRNIMNDAVNIDETDIVHDWPGKDVV